MLKMKRTLLALSILGFFTLSYSARGEHAGGDTSVPRTQKVPAIGQSDRLNELVSACSLGRPFPPLRWKEVAVDGGGSQAPVPVPPPTVNEQPPSSGNRANGEAIYQARCASCHPGNGNLFGNVPGVTARTNLSDDATNKMPPAGPRLSESEKADLLAFIATAK